MSGRPNGVTYRRLKVRDGYSVEFLGRVVGQVLRDPREGWAVEWADGAVVWSRYERRDDAARDLIERAGFRA